MIYPDNFENKIGFDIIRREVTKRCISAMGVGCCEQMHFVTDAAAVRQMLEQTDEMMRIVESGKDFPLNHYHDLRVPLKSALTPGACLQADVLWNLKGLLETLAQLERFFNNGDEVPRACPNLTALAAHVPTFPELVSRIGTILDRNGNVSDNASPELHNLRATIAQVSASMAGIMRRIMGQARQAGILEGDAQPVMRDGRLVLPVASVNKRRLHGIVHDESASGKTVFIEPDEIVEANNRIRQTQAEEAREIIRILTAVTDEIRPDVPQLLSAIAILGEIDFIRAKALFAIDTGGQLPNVDDEPVVEWYHAVHPALLLSLRAHGKEVVPLDIDLTQKGRLLVISGPNAGGKSVCLKTVGVVQYMAQCGVLPTIHDNSHVGIFESIMIDIGDQQSIENDLSTYSSHLLNMKTFLTRGNARSLILIDEMGSGTEPQIGGAIAQAILEQLNARGVTGVVTTHYQNLKRLAEETEGMVNGAMLYDRQKLQPLFQLSIGYPGSSFAIEIARKTGLPAAVIDKASEIVGSDYVNMDRYLLDIARDRRYWERKRTEIHGKEKRLEATLNDLENRLDQLKDQRKGIIAQARNEAREIVSQSNKQVERTIRGIKEAQAEKEKTRELRRQLDEFKQRLENEEETDEIPRQLRQLQPHRKSPRQRKPQPKPQQPAANAPIAAGDTVVIKGSDTVGTVISIDEKYATVAFGNIKTRVETSKIERTMRQATQAKPRVTVSRQTTDELRDRQLHFKPEIDIRGMRADEALQAITYFIDDALQFNASRVRILHGTGGGVLREVIRNYLSSVPGVTAFRDEHIQLGGTGITVVDLD